MTSGATLATPSPNKPKQTWLIGCGDSTAVKPRPRSGSGRVFQVLTSQVGKMNIFQKIINDKRGHAFALKHYSTKCVEDYDYFYHVSDNPNLTLLTPRIPSYSDEYKIYIKNLDTSIEEIELLQFPAVYFSPSAFDCLFCLCDKHFKHEKLYVYRTKKRLKLKSYLDDEFISFSSVHVEVVGIINNPSLMYDFTLYTTNFTEPLSYQDSAFLKLPKFP